MDAVIPAPPSLAVVVSFCSLEAPFGEVLLRELLRVPGAIIVVCHGTHLYNGTPEDDRFVDGLKQTFAENRNIVFARYDVPIVDGPRACHNAARKIGFATLESRTVSEAFDWQWVLFLDGDEIPDGTALADWWLTCVQSGSRLKSDTAYKIANYWYFMLPTLRAEELEDSAVLVHRSIVSNNVDCLSQPGERDGIPLAGGCCALERNVRHTDGRVLLHHFSWVRTREALLIKVASWGHRNDRPWTDLLLHTWKMMDVMGSMPERDFVNGYKLSVLDAPPFAFSRV